MKIFLAVVALVAIAGTSSASRVDQEFQDWKVKFGKSYGSEEEESQRKMIWLDNHKLILEHNKLADQDIKSYKLGMNHFGDMSHQEYQGMLMSCLKPFNDTEIKSESTLLEEDEGVALPRHVDWRKLGCVTRVKNQGHCGSSWAFSAVGALEGQVYKKKRMLFHLSEQQLVDCSSSYGNHGCHGGWPYKAFKYIMHRGGLQTERTYPYRAREGRCKFNNRKAWAKCYGYRTVARSERSLKYAVGTVGPISVCIDAGHHSFRFYKSGVYNELACSSYRPRLAVLVVGYGTSHRRRDYWLVKNNWGIHWGEQGYIRMSRNKHNQCGIATYATYPLV